MCSITPGTQKEEEVEVEKEVEEEEGRKTRTNLEAYNVSIGSCSYPLPRFLDVSVRLDKTVRFFFVSSFSSSVRDGCGC